MGGTRTVLGIEDVDAIPASRALGCGVNGCRAMLVWIEV